MNKQKGFSTILLVVILLVIGGGVYYYFSQNKSTDIVNNGVDTVATSSDATVSSTTPVIKNKTSLSDSQFISAVSGTTDNSKVLARGDINQDGYEDAIVQQMSCGASCSFNLQVVLNISNQSTQVLKPQTGYAQFEPAYVGSSASKSEITSVTIKDGVISLTGKGLACGFQNIYCQDEEWHKIRTVSYKFDGTKIIQIAVNPPLEAMKISKGTYEFSEFAQGNGGSNQTWVYRVYIKNDGGNGPITFNMDGFQTMVRVYATGVASGDSVDVVFDSFAPENTSLMDFKKGDILFTLTYSNGLTIVHWGKLQPILNKNKDGAEFVKISNSDALDKF